MRLKYYHRLREHNGRRRKRHHHRRHHRVQKKRNIHSLAQQKINTRQVQLHTSVRPSVKPSVRLSVRPSAKPSVKPSVRPLNMHRRISMPLTTSYRRHSQRRKSLNQRRLSQRYNSQRHLNQRHLNQKPRNQEHQNQRHLNQKNLIQPPIISHSDLQLVAALPCVTGTSISPPPTVPLMTDGWFTKLSPVLVISIRGRQWRLMQQRMAAVRDHLTLIRGTNGARINKSTWIREHRLATTRLKRGQIGCYDSHVRCWKYMIDHELPYALILEDDALIDCTTDMKNKISRVLQDVETHDPHWQLLYLARSRKRQPIKKRLTPHLAIPKYVSWGCFGYAVSLAGARILYGKSQPIRHTLDRYVSYMGEYHLRTYTAWPSLFWVTNHKSDTKHII